MRFISKDKYIKQKLTSTILANSFSLILLNNFLQKFYFDPFPLDFF